MKNSVKKLALFVSLVYVYDWFWHEPPLSIKMPLSDMQLLELLTNYPNRTIVKTTRNTFSRHFLVFFRDACWIVFLRRQNWQM